MPDALRELYGGELVFGFIFLLVLLFAARLGRLPGGARGI